MAETGKSEKVQVNFVGGSITMSSGGKYMKDGEERVSRPSVKQNGVFNQWDTCDPAVFRSMIQTISADQKAMAKLNEICK